MGASCQCQQQGSDTYQNQETQWHIPISKEFRPKPINTSIKHDLRANYQDLDCQYCNRPQMREMGAQTHVTFCNISQCDTQKEQKSEKQKPKKCKDKASFENSESSKQRSSSQYSQTQNILLLYQSLKSQGRQYQQQKAKPYEVLVNSQKYNLLLQNSFEQIQFEQK